METNVHTVYLKHGKKATCSEAVEQQVELNTYSKLDVF